MKKIILVSWIFVLLLACNKDDDRPEPTVEEEPDLSFPECLLSNDIFEYNLIMSNPPDEPTRAHIVKSIYQGVPVYSFNHEVILDLPLVFYNNQCEEVCRYVWNGPGTTCINLLADLETIGVVWTDPR
ncbi:hypothetical protein IA57_05805 [Mangrovimonas yunxiaonensis]|uniref:Lipoprotein n=1 Tax=Mangrovimonas yunxiaonensis TaxID=1197477 RepID=A0A084TKV5_9FLAO|nr:hypothetical protein [Mangrovimonas yunxiaonensis]KFB01341.1 hypothetical protein IA57_05805 [Mangrovimonas yunxiaonensis]GGH37265.1 hypothetical protein GCM10011364_05110 [Mangrovimonas yunxiaonensis]